MLSTHDAPGNAIHEKTPYQHAKTNHFALQMFALLVDSVTMEEATLVFKHLSGRFGNPLDTPKLRKSRNGTASTVRQYQG